MSGFTSGDGCLLMMILAKRAHAHMKAGSLTGLSIGYVLKDWEYDRSKEAFLLKEIDLWEVSLVTFPSNDEARISDVKNALARGEIPEQKIERVLRDVGLSCTQAKAFMAGAMAHCPCATLRMWALH